MEVEARLAASSGEGKSYTDLLRRVEVGEEVLGEDQEEVARLNECSVSCSGFQ